MEVSYVSLKFPQFNHLCSVKNLQKKFMIKLLLANFQKHAWMTDKTIILLASTPPQNFKIGIFVTIFNGFYPLTILAKPSPREKCPYTEFFLVRFFLYSDWMRRKSSNSVQMQENKGQKKLRIWTLFTECLHLRCLRESWLCPCARNC